MSLSLRQFSKVHQILVRTMSISSPTFTKTEECVQSLQPDAKRLKKSSQSTEVNLVKAQIALEDLEHNERRLRSLLLEVSDHVTAHSRITRPELRFTGGWVRDKLMGSRSDDIDVSITTMTGMEFAKQVRDYTMMEEVKARYGENVLGKTAKIGANPKMSKHLETATVKFWKSLEVDFVNTRTETYSEKSRTPQMQYGSPREDANRRDATINALFYNLKNSEIEDLTGRGIRDLGSHLIKTPLEPAQTFTDDPLRILRHIRFASRFGFDIDPEDRSAMSNEDIKGALRTKVTRERVFKEIEKTLKGPDPSRALQLVDELGLYMVIFAEPDKSPLAPNHLKTWSSTYRALRAIIHSDPEDVFHHRLKSLLFNEDVRPKPAPYRAWLLCAIVPWTDERTALPDGVIKSDTSGKRLSQAAMAVKHGLKGAGTELVDMAENAATHSHDISRRAAEMRDTAPVKDTGTVPFLQKSELDYRVEMGKAIRRWGPGWRESALYALLMDIAKSSTTEEGMTSVLQAYLRWLERLKSLGLFDVASLKPIVNGKKMQEELGCSRAGPWLKVALDMVIDWQLANPNANGADETSKTKAIAHVLSRKGELRFE